MVAHAAGRSAQLAGAPSVAPPVAVVVLAAPLDELIALHGALLDRDLPHVLVREPDEPWQDAPMAIGVVPMPRVRARHLLARLRLLRGKVK
jgi:hypothetical protein